MSQLHPKRCCYKVIQYPLLILQSGTIVFQSKNPFTLHKDVTLMHLVLLSGNQVTTKCLTKVVSGKKYPGFYLVGGWGLPHQPEIFRPPSHQSGFPPPTKSLFPDK